MGPGAAAGRPQLSSEAVPAGEMPSVCYAAGKGLCGEKLHLCRPAQRGGEPLPMQSGEEKNWISKVLPAPATPLGSPCCVSTVAF